MKSKCKNCIYKDLNLSASNCEDCVRFINHSLKQLNRSISTVLIDLYNLSLKMAVNGYNKEHMIILPSKEFFTVYDSFARDCREFYELESKFDCEVKDFDLQTISNIFNVKLSNNVNTKEK